MIKALAHAVLFCMMAMSAVAADVQIETTFMPSSCARKAEAGDQARLGSLEKRGTSTYTSQLPSPFSLA